MGAFFDPVNIDISNITITTQPKEIANALLLFLSGFKDKNFQILNQAYLLLDSLETDFDWQNIPKETKMEVLQQCHHAGSSLNMSVELFSYGLVKYYFPSSKQTPSSKFFGVDNIEIIKKLAEYKIDPSVLITFAQNHYIQALHHILTIEYPTLHISVTEIPDKKTSFTLSCGDYKGIFKGTGNIHEDQKKLLDYCTNTLDYLEMNSCGYCGKINYQTIKHCKNCRHQRDSFCRVRSAVERKEMREIIRISNLFQSFPKLNPGSF